MDEKNLPPTDDGQTPEKKAEADSQGTENVNPQWTLKKLVKSTPATPPNSLRETQTARELTGNLPEFAEDPSLSSKEAWASISPTSLDSVGSPKVGTAIASSPLLGGSTTSPMVPMSPPPAPPPPPDFDLAGDPFFVPSHHPPAIPPLVAFCPSDNSLCEIAPDHLSIFSRSTGTISFRTAQDDDDYGAQGVPEYHRCRVMSPPRLRPTDIRPLPVSTSRMPLQMEIDERMFDVIKKKVVRHQQKMRRRKKPRKTVNRVYVHTPRTFPYDRMDHIMQACVDATSLYLDSPHVESNSSLHIRVKFFADQEDALDPKESVLFYATRADIRLVDEDRRAELQKERQRISDEQAKRLYKKTRQAMEEKKIVPTSIEESIHPRHQSTSEESLGQSVHGETAKNRRFATRNFLSNIHRRVVGFFGYWF